ncbi:MAG TPA: imidazole glycerol phosphate synthase subunit HisH [Puia sp.]|nr:imidazole glycerol phosphate synthase subunit HisH [Puia sp.]
MEIVIIKYNAGNIQSVLYALERIGEKAVVSDDPAKISQADKVIFPGVGEAGSAMKYLSERGLDKVIVGLGQPVLGICLGMQLMCRFSEENNTNCLGIFDEEIKKFPSNHNGPDNHRFKIPQIGWNNIYELHSPLFHQIKGGSYCYFVHGYYASTGKHTIGKTDYIIPYSSALAKNNFYGVQFHPEKSASIGEVILRNFINMK